MKIFALIGVLFLLYGCNNQPSAQNQTASKIMADNSFVFANWNIEWFGSKQHGPYNLDLQEENTSKILKYIHPTLIGICEVVDTARFGRMVRTALGVDYAYTISPTVANGSSRNKQAWIDGQKMAFVFNKKYLSHVTTRPMLQTSKKAYYNFSNGRFPYLLEAMMQVQNRNIPIAVILIHAKSGSDIQSYQRRLWAAQELSDSIRTNLNQPSVMLMGDLNDELTQSIAKGQPSPYALFSQDNNYRILTTPDISPHGGSTLHYNTIIDNQIVNTQLYNYYISGSCKIRKDVASVVQNFDQGNTSDHYPVSSEFNFNNNTPSNSTPKANTNTPPTSKSTFAQLTSSTFTTAIAIIPNTDLSNTTFVLKNAQQKIVLTVHKKALDNQKTFYLKCKELPSGKYILTITSGGNTIDFDITKE